STKRPESRFNEAAAFRCGSPHKSPRAGIQAASFNEAAAFRCGSPWVHVDCRNNAEASMRPQHSAADHFEIDEPEQKYIIAASMRPQHSAADHTAALLPASISSRLQ